MRVIAGRAKGHNLNTPQGLDTRPTLDRVKESVFSMLYPYLEGSYVLDLFAGSGGLGIEAISRGAEKCAFVDSSKKAYDCILENLKHTKLSDYASVYLKKADDFLNHTCEKFHIIFLDPPYSKGIEDDIFPKLLKVIEDNGVIVLETETPAGEFEGFDLIKQVRYGRVYISVYKKGESK